MAIRYYDDAIIQKIQKWIPENSNLRILKPDESKRLFELIANDTNDKPIQLPFIALSRNNDIELLSTTKCLKSFSGLILGQNESKSIQMNVIPVKTIYQLDIYTKTYIEGDEYLRNFLFKLINNPQIKIEIPYNDLSIQHTANLNILPNVSDTSSIGERIFSGQFTRWSIQIELQDAFLFSVPYRKNWTIGDVSIVATDDVTKFDPTDIIEPVFNLEEELKNKN